jgi:hypothetical protein
VGGQCVSCGSVIAGCVSCSSGQVCSQCSGDYDLEGGNCVDNTGLTAAWIIVIVIAGLVLTIGIGVVIYYFWRRRRGFMGGEERGEGSALRATYYEMP